MDLKIESGIPMPKQGGSQGNTVQQTLRNLGVGDSFLYPKAKRSSLGSMYVRVPGAKFATRSVDANTIRVWRTA
jgi:hypothetical protein